MDKTIGENIAGFDFIAFRNEMEMELSRIIKWWLTYAVDEKNEGFFGEISSTNLANAKADKGVILNTRLLWGFSEGFLHNKNEDCLLAAKKTFEYIQKNFLDRTNGGLFWLLDYKGEIVNPKKQIYAQAFGIYALSNYYLLSNNEEAILLAEDLFELIEKYSFDKISNGYYEAFTKDWQPIADLRLSEKDVNASKTMNTHLHIMEAYTKLCSVRPSDKIKSALSNLVSLFIDKFIDEQYHQRLFFDEKWNSLSRTVSFGHDIECSWLLWEAGEVLGDDELLAKLKPICLNMAEASLNQGIDETGAMIYDQFEDGHLDKEKHWWVQNEAVIGFFNAYQISGDERYLKAMKNVWSFSKEYLIDTETGEWFWSVLGNNEINKKDPKASAWKAFYHNGRMCFEVMNRIQVS